MPAIKAVFFAEDKWEGERFAAGVPSSVSVVQLSRTASEAEAKAACRDADMVISGRIVRDPEVAKTFRKLKLVQVLSAGTDYLPVGALAEMGVRVANNQGANSVAVAEVTVTLMVSTYRWLMVQWDQTNKKGTYHAGFEAGWERFHELTGKRVGIVGLGYIGSAVARRLQGWECEIVYHDIRKFDADYLEKAGNPKQVPFDELLSTSDVITNHTPLTPQARHMYSDREFGMMKPGAIFINASRGGVHDEKALIRALDSGKIAGAGLDVTEIEPIEPGNPLIGRDNVVLLPHRAGTSIEARQKAVDNAARNAARLAEGKDPTGIVLPT